MPAYIIALINVNDRDAYNQYRAGVHDILNKYKGEIIISNENIEIIEGYWP